jgi:hypothetical protein
MLPRASMACGLYIPTRRCSAASQLFIPCLPGQTAFQTASYGLGCAKDTIAGFTLHR